LICPASSTCHRKNAYRCTKFIAFGTRTKRNRKQSELFSVGNKSTNCANVTHIFVRTSSDLIVYEPEYLYFLPHLTWYVIFCAVSGWLYDATEGQQTSQYNVDFFDSGNSGTLSYSRYSLNDLGTGTNNSRSWDESNLQFQDRSMM